MSAFLSVLCSNVEERISPAMLWSVVGMNALNKDSEYEAELRPQSTAHVGTPYETLNTYARPMEPSAR